MLKQKEYITNGELEKALTTCVNLQEKQRKAKGAILKLIDGMMAPNVSKETIQDRLFKIYMELK